MSRMAAVSGALHPRRYFMQLLPGFMLSDAWLAYQTAIADVRNEAVAALIVYRTSALRVPPLACDRLNAKCDPGQCHP